MTAAPQTGAVSSQAPLRIESCLSPADLREEVGERRVIPARGGDPRGPHGDPPAEIQRASLCLTRAASSICSPPCAGTAFRAR